MFNETVETAHARGHLSGEHFSIDGTLIQAWAGHQSFVRKNKSDDDTSPGGGARQREDWHGQKRSNETHQSSSNSQANSFRKSRNTGAMLCYLGDLLTDNRHGLVVNVQATQANDTAGFVATCRVNGVTPHVAQNDARGSAIAGRTTRWAGYAISQRKRKRIEQVFGWGKTTRDLVTDLNLIIEPCNQIIRTDIYCPLHQCSHLKSPRCREIHLVSSPRPTIFERATTTHYQRFMRRSH